MAAREMLLYLGDGLLLLFHSVEHGELVRAAVQVLDELFHEGVVHLEVVCLFLLDADGPVACEGDGREFGGEFVHVAVVALLVVLLREVVGVRGFEARLFFLLQRALLEVLF